MAVLLLVYPLLVACGPTPSAVAPVPTVAPTAAAPTAAPVAKAQPAPTTAGAAAPTTAAAPAQPTAAAKPAETGAKKGGTFVDVSFGDAVTMQPLLAQDNPSRIRIDLVYAQLLKYNKNLELVGELAKSYKVSDDKLSIAFELRDAVWSDGKPITTDDVKFSFDLMMKETTKYPYRGQWASFEALEVTGPKTFVFKLKQVSAPALDRAGGFYTIPKHIFEGQDINQNDANTKPPVSSGRFIFKEWVKDDHATFTANDKYYGGRPNLDTYIFRVVKDATVAYSMLKTGEADATNIAPQDFEEAKASPVFDVYRYYYFAAPWDFIGMNFKNPILADKKVRLALSYGLDKKKMIERIMLGFAKPQNSIYPTTSPAYTDEVARFDFDVAKAKALLDEAGWKPGSDGIRVKDGQKLKLRILFNAGNKRREQIATIAQQYWKEIGVDTEVNQEEFGAVIKRITETKDFDLLILGFTGGFEPDDAANIWVTGRPQNVISYSNPQVDELFKKGVTVSYDMKERKPTYVEIQKLVAEDQPYIFLWTQEDVLGVNKRIKGVDPNPLGLRWNAEQVYSETGR